MKIVEMHLAYRWDCDECGRENFERAVVHEFSPEERQELLEMGEKPETGHWVTPLEHVQCRFCNAEFETRRFDEEE